MAEKPYTLIGLDQMEPSVVRRRLRRWSKEDQEAVILPIRALQQEQCLSSFHIVAPQYETNVYPLYYYWFHAKKVSHRQVYDRVFQSLPIQNVSMPERELRSHIGHTVDTEIDILIEDVDYFIFIEAKQVGPSGKIKFEKKGGVHQLVSQYVQGKILEKEISKTFALATLGANKGETQQI